jgi:hypothetical protein
MILALAFAWCKVRPTRWVAIQAASGPGEYHRLLDREVRRAEALARRSGLGLGLGRSPRATFSGYADSGRRRRAPIAASPPVRRP